MRSAVRRTILAALVLPLLLFVVREASGICVDSLGVGCVSRTSIRR